MDSRFEQANREARWSLALTLLYLLAWALTAYGIGNTPGFSGLPLWFELSCIVVPAVFVVLCWLMVRYMFEDMPLDAHLPGDKGE